MGTMKKILPLLLAGFFISSVAIAKDTYLYKGRIDMVRIEKAPKALRKVGLGHPHSISEDKMRSILAAIYFDRHNTLTEDLRNKPVFDDRSVEFLTPYLVAAFERVGPQQVVHATMVVKDPKAIIRDDHLLAFTAYMKDGRLNIEFSKIFAKLTGDYQRKGAETLLYDSNDMGATLRYRSGMAPSDTEDNIVIVDLSYDFSKDEDFSRPQFVNAMKTEKEAVTAVQVHNKTIKERLKDLKKLKEDELITDKEYERKRKELIDQL